MKTKSLTESGIDDMMPIIPWTCYLLLSQGYEVIENLLLQDNKSSILLERNRKASSGKGTRHINIHYFFITDQVNMKELTIEWCSMKQMVADYETEPILGSHFRHQRDYIIGRVGSSKPKMEAVSIDKKINNKKKKVNSAKAVSRWWHSK